MILTIPNETRPPYTNVLFNCFNFNFIAKLAIKVHFASSIFTNITNVRHEYIDGNYNIILNALHWSLLKALLKASKFLFKTRLFTSTGLFLSLLIFSLLCLVVGWCVQFYLPFSFQCPLKVPFSFVYCGCLFTVVLGSSCKCILLLSILCNLSSFFFFSRCLLAP